MELKHYKSKQEKIKSKYVIDVCTMEGDADGYNNFDIIFDEKDIEELKKVIIYCEVLERQYPNGRGGYDTYNSLDFFSYYFDADWNYAYDGEIQDSMEGYSVYYYDENGEKFDVMITLSDEDIATIESYGILKS